MENATNQNYGQDKTDFQYELATAGSDQHHDFQNEEFINDSPNRHPEQDRNPDYPLRYDYDEEDEDEEIDPDDEDDLEEEDADDETQLKGKSGTRSGPDIFSQDLLNPFTTDAGL